MIYSNLYINKNNKKIPTLLGLILVFFVFILFFSLTNKTAMISKASKVNVKRVEITNLSPIQATVYWQTDIKETGWVVYGEKEDKLINVAFDDRDIIDKKENYFNHYVTLKNLKPGRHYYYALISGNKKIIKPDGSFFQFFTPLNSIGKTKIDPATGKVLKSNLNPLKNAIVLLFVDEKTLPLSTITKESGEWLISLNSFYDKSTYNEKSFSGEEKIKVEIISEDDGLSIINSKLKDLALKQELVIIGKNYNFLDEKSNDVLSASTNSKEEENKELIKIIYPQENAIIPGRRPLIKGTSILREKEIFINITNSFKTFSARVIVNKDGNWNYLIPEDLDLGKYKIIAKAKDKFGKEIITLRSFSVVSNQVPDAKVLGVASGEPTITYMPSTPTLLPTTSPVYFTPTVSLLKSGTSSSWSVIGGLILLTIGSGIWFLF